MPQPSIKLGSKSTGSSVPALTLTALGIVFGDIGTSPLYTLKTVVALAGGHPSPEVALGLLSLVIWTLLIVTSIKYVTFVMRVDNHGEGGILALMSLLGVKKSGIAPGLSPFVSSERRSSMAMEPSRRQFPFSQRSKASKSQRQRWHPSSCRLPSPSSWRSLPSNRKGPPVSVEYSVRS
jgi:K+ potassium transporter